MRRSYLISFLFLLFAVPAFGQGMRYDNFVLKPLAAGGVTPVSGALITVCTSAGSGTPCTPKVANIYSDEALTTPLTGTGGAGTTNSDANGNFGFYLTPGSYVATITGSGITSYTIKMTLGATVNSQILEDILWVGSGGYATISAAQTAAGVTNKTIIGIRSTYAGVECPSGYTPNIIFWDFRGGAVVCGGNNWIGYGTKDASGVNTLTRSVQTIQGTTLQAGGAIAGNYGQVYINSVNFNNSFADGGSNELDFFGAQTGTLPLASGAELDTIIMGTAQGSASTGGTITRAVGAQGYVTTFAGSTTVIGTAVGFEGLGCASTNTLIQGVVPSNCYGLYGKSQLASASARNYSLGFEGLALGLYDSAPNCSANCQNLAGLDLEDNAHATHHVLYNDSSNNLILQATAAGTGILLEDSATGNQLGVTSSGVRIFSNFFPNTAGGVDLGKSTNPFRDAYLGPSASNAYQFHANGTPTGIRLVNINDPGQATTSLPLVIANGTKALNTASITTATCDAGVAATATGTLSTDAVDWSFNAAPTATNKYGAFLVVYAVPSANTVTFYTCNPSATTSTPTAMTVNWSVRRP